MPENLEIRNIRTDGGTQPRAGLDDKTVADYGQEIQDGAKFPPVVVFHDGSHYWLADGFHRVAAFKFAGKQRIPAEIKQGTLRDAQLYAVGANATHGLRRSREDKRRAVMMMLDDGEWGNLSDRDIARYCKVSHTFVANVKRESGNVATNALAQSGNVATNGEVTAVLRHYLEKEYNTTEPATLAVMARALSSRREHCMTIESRLKLYQAGPDGVRAGLIALAQELQGHVPEPNGNGTAVPNMPVLFELLDGIKRLTPEAAYSVRQWCEGISVRSDAKDHAHVWDSMEKLLCVLRPN